jgi:polysaccharide export outer membrane protein
VTRQTPAARPGTPRSRPRAGRLAAALALVLVPGDPLHAQADEDRPAIVEEIRRSSQALAPGDSIRLTFWREPDLSGAFAVDERGVAVLPIIGPVRVTDTDAPTLRLELEDAYRAELRNQDVEIALLRRIRVLGEVNEPGIYHVDPAMTLGDAIALAGGVSGQGKLDGIEVRRGDVVVRDDLEESEPIEEILSSGDRITVPRKSWFARHSTVVLGGALSATALILSRLLVP